MILFAPEVEELVKNEILISISRLIVTQLINQIIIEEL